MSVPAPSFDTWTSLFLLAASQGLFLAMLIWLRPRKNKGAGIWIIALLLAFSGLLIFNVSYWTKYNLHYTFINLAYPALAYLIGPFFLFYLDGISTQSLFKRFRILHFLPAIIVFLLRLLAYSSLLSSLPLPTWGISLLFSAPFLVLHLLVYGGLVIWYGLSIIKTIKNELRAGRMQEKFRKWMIVLISLFSAYTAAFVSYYLLANMAFFSIEYDYLISVVMAISIYVIGYLEYRDPGLIAWSLESKNETPKYNSSSLTPTAQASIVRKLKSHMEIEKPYRDSDLRLSDLANALHITPHQLSQVINGAYGKSFNQFINEFRVKEAQELLLSKATQRPYIIEIAYQVGFNNKTTFNHAFKLQTGMSPSKWRSQSLETLR